MPALLVVLALMVLVTTVVAEPLQLEKLWGLDPGSRAYITSTDNNQRGMAYNPVTRNVLLVNRTGGLSINRVDSLTGADRGTLNVTGISGGTFALNYIGVADDGVIYAANLTTDDRVTPFKVYRWADENAAPTLAFSGALVGDTTQPRWGDSMDIRGSGNNTQLLFSQGRDGVGNRIAVLTTTDNGVTLTPTVMPVAGLNLGDTRGGVAFGQGNSFFTKGGGSSTGTLGTTLRYGTFDLASASATVTATSTLPSGLSGFAPLGSAPGQNLLGAIQISMVENPQPEPHKLFLFNVSDPGNPVVLDFESFVSPGSKNGNGVGSVDFGPAMVFALATNNGLMACKIVPEPSTFAALAAVAIMAALLWRRRR